ncbi:MULTISPECIES: divalent-cation tolerance protein CutA [unclassified Coleofasciculus]|uniref:divalent-cation tolerance protein CutA n=1 Tax=unclassified Coleofasciculus TaxID=2692782 RepID=UPI0018819FAD|nr:MULTISPECIES: divalent-cation tolerance protein CutA [unclassified Coleofasciculus]MBE9125636.1 divalent-cation tolerance protein CutA [Coleofasciculus sp. LEGE 07081]MBE9148790.1 divalent-cation tolerance protein CutA [Coleofasciculus sp. LEGE 07092]
MDNNSIPSYGVVLVTASSENEGEAIAKALVESRMAACVNLKPVRSIYTWEGKVNLAQEWQLIIKTDLAQLEALAAKIRELHSYEVPEIIALPIVAGSESYLQWISDNVSS